MRTLGGGGGSELRRGGEFLGKDRLSPGCGPSEGSSDHGHLETGTHLDEMSPGGEARLQRALRRRVGDTP